jgi:acetyl-CoA carboxylase carboxyl transferase subunit beta
MNWLTNFVRPKIKALVSSESDVPENLWLKCKSCEAMIFHRDLENNLNVCPKCDYHMRIGPEERLKLMFDNGQFNRVELPKVKADPLKFKDLKKYTDRLKEARQKTGEEDALVVAQGLMGGQPTVIAVFNFFFMGGSMGMAVGEGLVRAAELAVEKNAAFITVPASGGARMQEGILSLMQLPRSIIAIERVKRANLPYIVLLTDPTTGGVSASFAMIGDVHVAEKGCMIGFAGARVIENTIREKLPEGFQTAEYLEEHGMVDVVVHRKNLKAVIENLLSLLMKPKPKAKAA